MSEITGRSMADPDLRDRPTALFFGFTWCPAACPGEAAGAHQYIQAHGNRRRPHQRCLRHGRSRARHNGSAARLPPLLRPSYPRRYGHARATRVMAAAFKVQYRRVPLPRGDYTMDHTAAVIQIDAAGASPARSHPTTTRLRSRAGSKASCRPRHAPQAFRPRQAVERSGTVRTSRPSSTVRRRGLLTLDIRAQVSAHFRPMTAPMTLGLRRNLVAVLIIALTLAGLGRAIASTERSGLVLDVIPGIHLPICHSGAGESPADPAQPVSHDCCDDCALMALAVLPAPPVQSGPTPVEHFADHARAIAWAPVLARPRDPRLSRGPPAA